MKRGGTEPTTISTIFSTRANGEQVVALTGAIDENTDLQALFAGFTGDIVLNLQNVERVNSMGVHRWIPIVTRFSSQHLLVIEQISYALVQNANVVRNMFGSARVRSCMAPYFCAKCKNNCTMTVTDDEMAEAETPPLKHCGQCGSEMEFDELDGYFSFFKIRPVK